MCKTASKRKCLSIIISNAIQCACIALHKFGLGSVGQKHNDYRWKIKYWPLYLVSNVHRIPKARRRCYKTYIHNVDSTLRMYVCGSLWRPPPLLLLLLILHLVLFAILHSMKSHRATFRHSKPNSKLYRIALQDRRHFSPQYNISEPNPLRMYHFTFPHWHGASFCPYHQVCQFNSERCFIPNDNTDLYRKYVDIWNGSPVHQLQALWPI